MIGGGGMTGGGGGGTKPACPHTGEAEAHSRKAKRPGARKCRTIETRRCSAAYQDERDNELG